MGLQDNLRAATHWELEEERDLIPFLTTRKSKARDTMNLRGSVFADANNHLNKLYPAQRHAAKSQSACKTKWGNQLIAATDIGEALPQTSQAVLTSSHISSESTRDLELTSDSRGKRKYNLNVLDDGGSPQKRPCSPSLTAKAQQEGSEALTSIAQILLQLIDSLASSSSAQPEHPPSTSLGCAIAALSNTEGLEFG